MISEILIDTLVDTAKMAPLLFVIYAGIEFLEYKFGDAIISKVKKAGVYGPLIGALAGLFPQCGFSVIATALFTQRLATVGTLLAVYLSTSDEALPIIMSMPEKIGIVIPLIATKLGIALVAGYAIDLVFKKNNKKIFEHVSAYSQGIDDKSHHHESATEALACCGHSADAKSKKFDTREIFLHPLIHTLKIFVFIFAISLTIGMVTEAVGPESLARFFSGNALLGPVLTALVGLIPNCAASVAITELYLKGIITYGAAIAGLCASGGLGLLVLLKEEKDKKIAAVIIGLLFGISVFAGTVIQLFF